MKLFQDSTQIRKRTVAETVDYLLRHSLAIVIFNVNMALPSKVSDSATSVVTKLNDDWLSISSPASSYGRCASYNSKA